MPRILEAGQEQRAAAPLYQGRPIPESASVIGGAAQGGQAVSDAIGSLIDAQREVDWSKAKAGTYSEMMQLYGSLDQEQDPAAIRAKWDEGRQAIRRKYGDALAGDARLSRMYDELATHYETSLGMRVDGLADARVKDQGRASLLSNLSAYEDSLTSARSDADYDAALHNGLTEIANKRATGILGAEEAERERLRFTDKVRGIQAKVQEESRLQGAYSTLYTRFGGDADAIAEFLEDPKNQAAAGLNFKEALSFMHTFEAQAAADERRAAKAREQGEKAESEAFYQAVLRDDAAGALNVLKGAKHLPAEKVMGLRGALGKRAFEDDPAVVARTQQGVWSGAITDKAEIAGLVGRGLSPRTAEALRNDLESVRKDAPPFAGAMNYYTTALKKFDVAFQNDADVLAQGDKFAASLAYMAWKKGVGPWDPEMGALADELLKKSGGFMGLGKSTTFERDLKAGTLPYQQPGAVQPAPKPSGPQGLAARIPAEEYAEIKAGLATLGKPTDDDAIYTVWMASKGKK